MAKIFNYDPRDPEFYNPIINGNLDFWQRVDGDAVTRTNSGSTAGYVADRIRNAVSEGAAKSITIQRSTNIPTTNYPLTYSCQITNNTAIASFPSNEWIEPFNYSFESIMIRPLVGNNLTLGFWIFSSIAGTYAVAFRRNNFTRSYVTTITVNTANTWEYKIVQIPWDTAVAQSYDPASPGFNFVIGAVTTTSLQAPILNTWETANRTSHASATNWAATAGAVIRIAQVQLRNGYRSLEDMRDGFIPFAPTYDQELAACQRYFEIVQINSNSYMSIFGLSSGTPTFFGYTIQFNVIKRAIPLVSFSILSGEWHWVVPGVARYSADNNSNAVSISSSQSNFNIRQTRQSGNSTPTNGSVYVLEVVALYRADAEF
jgi:hypothetical protein